MIAGTKLLCRNLSSPGTTRSGLLPFFSYCGLKIGADYGIIVNMINVRECSHKSEFLLEIIDGRELPEYMTMNKGKICG